MFTRSDIKRYVLFILFLLSLSVLNGLNMFQPVRSSAGSAATRTIEELELEQAVKLEDTVLQAESKLSLTEQNVGSVMPPKQDRPTSSPTSSPSTSSPTSSPTTAASPPTIDETTANDVGIRAIVMTYNRAKSLRRLLKSLVEADYRGDRAHINIWIDRPDNKPPDAPTVAVAREFEEYGKTWKDGGISVHIRDENVGLAAQWLETWPLSLKAEGKSLGPDLKERAVILEDDLEVSPHYWRWLKGCHAAYEHRPDFAGCTLQRASLCAAECPTLDGGPGSGTMNFMYPLVGSWGYSPAAKQWTRFLAWRKDFKEKPAVPGLTPWNWYQSFEKQGRCPGKRCMWTMHHIRYCNTHPDRLSVYVTLPNKKTLATNWQENGLHYSGQASPSHQRLMEWKDEYGVFEDHPTVVGWNGRNIDANYKHPTKGSKSKNRFLAEVVVFLLLLLSSSSLSFFVLALLRG